MKTFHKDCKYYLAIDVFKGLCIRDQEGVNADESSCEEFERMAICKYCEHYTPQQEGLGKCKNLYDAYPDMAAKTCEHFSWAKQKN